jgi:hypothetical protein
VSLVTAAGVAKRYAVSRDYVYAHAAELGAIRLGTGPRARLRFDLETVAAALSACSASRQSDAPAKPPAEPIRRRRRPAPLGTDVELLPIRRPKPAPGRAQRVAADGRTRHD